MDQNRTDFGVEGAFSVKSSARTRSPISKPLEKSGGPLSKRICAAAGTPQTITRNRTATDTARRIIWNGDLRADYTRNVDQPLAPSARGLTQFQIRRLHALGGPAAFDR